MSDAAGVPDLMNSVRTRLVEGKAKLRQNIAGLSLLVALGLVLSTCTSLPAAVTPLAGPGDFSPTATTINFDQHPHGTAVNTLYLAQGVEFFTNGSTLPIYNWSGIPRYTTSSPNVVAAVSGLNGSAFSSTVDLLFTSPTVEVGAYFGNDQNSAVFSQMTLSLFDAANDPLGSFVVATNNNTSVDQFIGLRSTVRFARARFDNASPQGLSIVLDNVMFTSVPEPSSFVLGASALAGLLACGPRRRPLARHAVRP